MKNHQQPQRSVQKRNAPHELLSRRSGSPFMLRWESSSGGAAERPRPGEPRHEIVHTAGARSARLSMSAGASQECRNPERTAAT